MIPRLLAAVVVLCCILPAPASAQCGVFKTWALNEVLTSSDLNQAFNRTVTANVASCATGDSSSVGQMRVVVDPFPGSAESLATTIQGELERLRFQIEAVVGKNYWYEVIDNSLAKDISKHWGATFTSYAEMADPPPPGSNDLRLYAKDDGAGVTVLAYKDSNGIINTLTGPSTSYGSSVTINYLAQNNPGTPGTKLDLTADRISVGGRIKETLAVTIDATTTGANALDTGALAGNTLYAVWLIVNSTTNTFAGLLSLSETAPTMPSGYTSKRMMGSWRTDGGVAFIDGVQRGQYFNYTAAIAVTAFGVTGVIAHGALASFVPNTIARSASVFVAIGAGPGYAVFKAGWKAFTGGINAGDSQMYAYVTNASFAGSPAQPLFSPPVRLPLNNSGNRSTIFIEVINLGVTLFVSGYEVEWKD